MLSTSPIFEDFAMLHGNHVYEAYDAAAAQPSPGVLGADSGLHGAASSTGSMSSSSIPIAGGASGLQASTHHDMYSTFHQVSRSAPNANAHFLPLSGDLLGGPSGAQHGTGPMPNALGFYNMHDMPLNHALRQELNALDTQYEGRYYRPSEPRPIPMSFSAYQRATASPQMISTSPSLSGSTSHAMRMLIAGNAAAAADTGVPGSPALSDPMAAAAFKRRKDAERNAAFMYANESSSPSMSPTLDGLANMSKKERNRLAAERCRKKKQELITVLSSENQALKQENFEMIKVNQVLEQKLDYLINVMANYGIPLPYKKT